MTVERLEFGSEPWIDELRRQVAVGLANADLTGIEFTLSEEFTDPPVHLLAAGHETIGFHIRISNGRVEVGNRPLPDADYRLVADYDSALPSVRRTHGQDPAADAEAQERAAELLATGKLHLTVRSERPDAITQLDLHDRMAARTA